MVEGRNQRYTKCGLWIGAGVKQRLMQLPRERRWAAYTSIVNAHRNELKSLRTCRGTRVKAITYQGYEFTYRSMPSDLSTSTGNFTQLMHDISAGTGAYSGFRPFVAQKTRSTDGCWLDGNNCGFVQHFWTTFIATNYRYNFTKSKDIGHWPQYCVQMCFECP